jgi:hypothetical protein
LPALEPLLADKDMLRSLRMAAQRRRD